MIDIKKITYRPTLHIILFIVRGALVSLLIHTWYLSHAVQVSNFSAWCQQIKNEHVFGDRNPTLACFSVKNFKLKMVLVSTKWQISCSGQDATFDKLFVQRRTGWSSMAEFPFEFSPLLHAEYEVNPELKVKFRDGNRLNSSSLKLMHKYLLCCRQV